MEKRAEKIEIVYEERRCALANDCADTFPGTTGISVVQHNLQNNTLERRARGKATRSPQIPKPKVDMRKKESQKFFSNVGNVG